MQRRKFVTGLGAAGVAAGLSACAKEPVAASNGTPAAKAKTFDWKMVTTWPPNFPGLGTGASNLAKRIQAASGGRIKIRVFAGGELVPPLEVFDAVSQGTAEIGHGGAYYWKAKVEAAQFMGTFPFGLNAAEMNAWFYYGDGLKLWREIYEPFGLVPFPAGNTGGQMGGWYNKKIDSMADLKNLKMRIPGLGGEVFARAGGTPVLLPGSEIFTALQTGSIDATEWVGPYNDIAFGLHKVARYYYYPGWHEPGPTLEAMINAEAWASLPDDLQEIVRVCCQSVNCDMLAEYTYRNAEAFQTLQNDPNVEVLKFPDEVLIGMREHTKAVIDELTARNADAKKIYASLQAFLQKSAPFQEISEGSLLAARKL
ncbi:MAG: TRAP transporter substrate-binding protein [Woeseiaceae bacterium]